MGQVSGDEATLAVLPASTPVVTPPGGLQDGINFINDSTVILKWRAPYKDFVFAVGDFNDWTISTASMMQATGDGQSFWIELTGLIPGEYYRYQYHIMPDDQRYADAYAEIILDQWNDPFGFQRRLIPTCCLIPDSSRVVLSRCSHRGIRFCLERASFERPHQENLLIYELVRDFTEDRL